MGVAPRHTTRRPPPPDPSLSSPPTPLFTPLIPYSLTLSIHSVLFFCSSVFFYLRRARLVHRVFLFFSWHASPVHQPIVDGRVSRTFPFFPSLPPPPPVSVVLFFSVLFFRRGSAVGLFFFFCALCGFFVVVVAQSLVCRAAPVGTRPGGCARDVRGWGPPPGRPVWVVVWVGGGAPARAARHPGAAAADGRASEGQGRGGAVAAQGWPRAPVPAEPANPRCPPA